MAVAALALAGLASATVSVNYSGGTGTVDRADVQTAFGWTNAEMAHNKRGVTFALSWFRWDAYRCASGLLDSVASRTTYGITSRLQGDYILQGRDGTSTFSGSRLPAIGDACPDGSTVTQLIPGDTSADLWARYGDQQVGLAQLYP
jgi:hypothetical protein